MPDRPRRELGFFALEDVQLPLFAGSGTSCEDVAAELVQLSSSLEVPLEQRFLPACNDEAGASFPEFLPVAFSFRVPDVRRRTIFEWRFQTCADGNSDCRILLNAPFVAFPQDLLAPLKTWAANNVLVVRDPIGALSEFLDGQGVPFFEGAAPKYPGAERVTLIVADDHVASERVVSRFVERGSVVLFREKSRSLPVVKSQSKGSHNLVTVELPLISTLPGNPLAQELLLQIFRLSQEKEP